MSYNSRTIVMVKKSYTAKFKERARMLRNAGLSYKEIAQQLKIVKSTARLWTQDVPLNAEQKNRLYTKGVEAMSNGPNSSKERRGREIEKILIAAKKEISLPINKDTYKLLGAMLYWAEGDKKKNFAITNSDPLLIRFMVGWMKEIFSITTKQLKAHLNIYQQQNDLEMKSFWSDLTGIPLENFGKSFVKPAGKGFKKNTLYYGTIKVRMVKGSDGLQRIFAWIKNLLSDLSIEVDKIETKWNKLKTERPHP